MEQRKPNFYKHEQPYTYNPTLPLNEYHKIGSYDHNNAISIGIITLVTYSPDKTTVIETKCNSRHLATIIAGGGQSFSATDGYLMKP